MAAPERPTAPSPAQAPPSVAAGGLRRSGALLAAATLLSNVLAYGLVVVLARVLPVGPVGAVGSLVNLSVIGGVPALAVQLVTARETARHLEDTGHGDPGAAARMVRPALGLAVAVGVLLGVVAAAAAPAAAVFLRLDGPAAPLLVAVTLPATTLVFAVQGLLQGAQRFGALSTVFVLLAGLRLAGGGLGGAVGGGPVAVVTGLLAGTVVAAALALVVLRRATAAPGGTPAAAPVPRPRALLADTARSTVSTSGLLVLLNVDVLLARHVLTAQESGLYTVGSLFAKAAFWGPAFVSTLLFARMSVERRRGRAVALGLLLTGGTGAAAVGGALALGVPLVRLVAGRPYEAVGSQAWLFAALGALLALAQVLVYARLAVADQWLGAAAWLAGAAICAVVLALPEPHLRAVVGTAVAGAAALAVVGLVLERAVLRRTA